MINQREGWKFHNEGLKNDFGLISTIFLHIFLISIWIYLKKINIVHKIQSSKHQIREITLKSHLSLPIISCFSTKKSNIPSVTPRSILNSLEFSSFIKIPCFIDSLIRVSFISMYCLNVILNFWHNSYYSFVKYVVFFSFFSTGASFLAARRVVP